jgi:hypothetical protein
MFHLIEQALCNHHATWRFSTYQTWKATTLPIWSIFATELHEEFSAVFPVDRGCATQLRRSFVRVSKLFVRVRGL